MSKSLEQLDSSIEDAHKRLYELRVKNRRLCLKNQQSRQRMAIYIERISTRTFKILREEQSKRASLQPYLSIVRSIMAGDSPQYLQTLQAKICQSLHFMYIAEDQLKHMNHSSAEQTMHIKAECAVLTDEAMHLTLDLVNKISAQDDENHNFRMAYLNVLKAQHAIIRMLDLLLQPSIGPINVPIAGDAGDFVRLGLARSREDQVLIKSGDLAKQHYMEPLEAPLEFGKEFNDSNSSLYSHNLQSLSFQELSSNRISTKRVTWSILRQVS